MGFAKKELMEREECLENAISLCIDIGALERCDAHGELLDTLEYQDAEELTTTILEEDPDAIESFRSRDRMVECVRDALDSAGEECGCCVRNADS